MNSGCDEDNQSTLHFSQLNDCLFVSFIFILLKVQIIIINTIQENDPLIILIAFVHNLLQFDVHSFKLMMVCFSLTPFYRFLRSNILVGKSKPHWVPLSKRAAPSNEYWVNHWNHNMVYQGNLTTIDKSSIFTGYYHKTAQILRWTDNKQR